MVEGVGVQKFGRKIRPMSEPNAKQKLCDKNEYDGFGIR
jgi:hypothetical protein